MEQLHDYGPRRSGRTTRLIDSSIQELFSRGYVICRDHYPTKKMAKYVFERVLKRVYAEHESITRDLKIDRNNFILALSEDKIWEAREEIRKSNRYSVVDI